MPPLLIEAMPPELVAPPSSCRMPPLLTVVLPTAPPAEIVSRAPDCTTTPAIDWPEATPSVKPAPSCKVPPDATVGVVPTRAPPCNSRVPPLRTDAAPESVAPL